MAAAVERDFVDMRKERQFAFQFSNKPLFALLNVIEK